MATTRKTVLITGATGYIGGQLAERLLQEDEIQIRVLARQPAEARRLAKLGCEIVPGDVTDAGSLERAVAGCELVYHAAAWVRETGARRDVWGVNVTGVQHLVDAASEAGVRRFIHLSSCAVYGSLQRLAIDETTPMRMSGSLYADSKVAAEEIVLRAHHAHGLPIVIVRPSQVYGLGSPQFTLRPLELIRRRRMVLIDGGRHLCKPIYIDNLVDGLILCARSDAAVGQAFNFSDGEPVTWSDFFGAYAQMLEVAKLPSLPYPLAWLAAIAFEASEKLTGKAGGLNRRVLRSLTSNNSFSNHKAQTILGWRPRVDLSEGMRRTEVWLRRHGYLDGAAQSS
jgi:nucleoside-diphosphate-sugar epimerase